MSEKYSENSNYDGEFRFPEPIKNTVFDRVAEIADRLGVKPYTYTGQGPSIIIHTSDNIQYDVYELVAALLDKIEAVAK